MTNRRFPFAFMLVVPSVVAAACGSGPELEPGESRSGEYAECRWYGHGILQGVTGACVDCVAPPCCDAIKYNCASFTVDGRAPTTEEIAAACAQQRAAVVECAGRAAKDQCAKPCEGVAFSQPEVDPPASEAGAPERAR